jgi:hypothetical protein
MELWRILAIIGAIIFYLGMMSIPFIMMRKEQKEWAAFWDKYFKLLEAKSKRINKDIEIGKIKVVLHDGKEFLIEGDK